MWWDVWMMVQEQDPQNKGIVTAIVVHSLSMQKNQHTTVSNFLGDRYADFPSLIPCDQPGPCASDGVCGFIRRTQIPAPNKHIATAQIIFPSSTTTAQRPYSAV